MTTLFIDKDERHRIGRVLSSILRHDLPTLGLVQDRHGSARVQDILPELSQRFGTALTVAHVEEIVLKDAQKRFHLANGLIRAFAGHTFDVVPTGERVDPPTFLYHGTAQCSVPGILARGLLRMGKAYVHVTDTVARARRIGLRKSNAPVLIKVSASEAARAGVRFWRSGQKSPDGEIYLSDEIEPTFLSACDWPARETGGGSAS